MAAAGIASPRVRVIARTTQSTPPPSSSNVLNALCTSRSTTRHFIFPTGYSRRIQTQPQKAIWLPPSTQSTRSHATASRPPTASLQPPAPAKSNIPPLLPYSPKPAPAPKPASTPSPSPAAGTSSTTESPPSESPPRGSGLGRMTPRRLNAFLVNTLSAHKEPPGVQASRRVVKEGTLPEKYRSAARRITMAVVALPIAIVTSWVLYQRLVLGEERKLLVKAPPAEPTSVEKR